MPGTGAITEYDRDRQKKRGTETETDRKREEHRQTEKDRDISVYHFCSFHVSSVQISQIGYKLKGIILWEKKHYYFSETANELLTKLLTDF